MTLWLIGGLLLFGAYKVAKFPDAMIAGDPHNPEIAALLIELQDYLASNGVNTAKVDAEALTRMRKGPKIDGRRPVAIPVRELWPNILPAARYLSDFPEAFVIYNGYRPPDYNAAVGGAAGSLHQDFSAVDFYGAHDRDRAALALAFDHDNKRTPGGAAVYGKVKPSMHVDGGKSRVWAEMRYWLRKVVRS